MDAQKILGVIDTPGHERVRLARWIGAIGISIVLVASLLGSASDLAGQRITSRLIRFNPAGGALNISKASGLVELGFAGNMVFDFDILTTSRCEVTAVFDVTKTNAGGSGTLQIELFDRNDPSSRLPGTSLILINAELSNERQTISSSGLVPSIPPGNYIYTARAQLGATADDVVTYRIVNQSGMMVNCFPI